MSEVEIDYDDDYTLDFVSDAYYDKTYHSANIHIQSTTKPYF